MPAYDYSCRDCGHNFETFQKIVEDPLRYCPRCYNGKVSRSLGRRSAVLFKTGFKLPSEQLEWNAYKKMS